MSEKTLGQLIGVIEGQTSVTPKGNEKGVGAVKIKVNIDFTSCSDEKVREYLRKDRIIAFVNGNLRNDKAKDPAYIKSFDGITIQADSNKVEFKKMTTSQQAAHLKSTLSEEQLAELRKALGGK